jgi:hypothetical protein
MKKLATIAFVLFFLSLGLAAQTPNPADDGFDVPFMVVLGCFMVGCIMVGAAITALLMLVLVALVSAGIMSTGVLVALYKKSFSAGFKAFLVLFCSVAGTAACAIAMALINHFFIHRNPLTALLMGAGGGLCGGMILGLILFFLIRTFLRYCRTRFSLILQFPPPSPSGGSH